MSGLCRQVRSAVELLLWHRQLDVGDAGHLQLFALVTDRLQRMTDFDGAGRPADFAFLGHGAREAGLVALHHCRSMIEVLSSARLGNVVAVGIDRFPNLRALRVSVEPGRSVELEGG